MIIDIVMQVAIILITLFMFLWMQKIPQNLFTKFRYRNRSSYSAKRYFIIGAQLLAKSRSTKDRSSAIKLAKSTAEEADKSIALDPKDAASYILLALALDVQGFGTSALEALDVALSPLTSKSLSGEEGGDSLLKRAEIKIKGSKRGLVDSAIDDLQQSVKLKGDKATAFQLLGECYEKKEMKEEAVEAYEGALKVDPKCTPAQDALNRLGSSSISTQ